MLLGKIAVAGWLKINLNWSGEDIESFGSVINAGSLKNAVLEQPDGRTELNERVEGLPGSGISDRLINLVKTLRTRCLKNLASFVIEGNVIAILAIKHQATEILTSGYKRCCGWISNYRQGLKTARQL